MNTQENAGPAPIGPFTKETFSLPKWKQITDKIYHLNTTNEQETIPYAEEMLQFLLELNNYPDYNQYFGDPSIKNYFLKEFFLNNAKYYIATKTFIKPEILGLSNACLEQMIRFWMKAMREDHPKLTEMAKIIFDIERAYYKINDQEHLDAKVISSFPSEPSHEHLAWVDSLEVEELIDCVKLDPTTKKVCWSHAKVWDISQNKIRVVFVYDDEKVIRDLDKEANANEIAPFKSKCSDFDWRMNLKEGDEVDAFDTYNNWYNSTVLKVREIKSADGQTGKEVLIGKLDWGYRIYDEEGNRYDQDGRTFIGWSEKYDEWVNVTSPRLSKKNSVAKKFYMAAVASNENDPVIEDSDDRIYTAEDGGTLYAITRPADHVSLFAVNLVNKFGEAGGFDKILERISDTQHWAPIEIVSFMVTIVGNLNPILHRNFVQEYVPKLKEAVWKNLLNSPDSNIRNFSKERIDSIVNAFNNLLKRVYSLPEKNKMLETLNLDICSICFDSNFLERKIQGLKSLLELMKTTRLGNSKFITTESLNKFIAENQIFDKIYGSKGHKQLIQRSSDFLGFMATEGNLPVSGLATIWNATTKGDTETKLATYKVLADISNCLHAEHLDFIINKVSQIPPEELIPAEIELISELNKTSLISDGFSGKALSFYWNIITDSSDQYAKEIQDGTLVKFCDILKDTLKKDNRMQALYNCISNLEKGVAVIPSLKIMKKLIEHYPTTVVANDNFLKKTCVEHLCNEKNVLNILMKDLKTFKETIKRKIGEQKITKEEDLNNLLGDKTNYLVSISERLQFILYIFANRESESGQIGITYELLSELWDVMVTEAFLPGEKDVVYKWVKETAESKAGFPMSIEDLLKFFQEKINNAQDYQHMTTEGFNCFKNLFLVINEKLSRISKVNTSGVVSYASSYAGYGVSYLSYSYNYEESNKANQEEFNYKIHVLPEELEGVQSIWNFILASENEAVAEKAIDFLNKLYLHVSPDLEDKITYMRSEYLSTCFKHLKELLDKKDQLDKKTFNSSSLRCLSLIRSIMDESEKRGIGHLKSHSGLVKGELLNFNVNNEISYGYNVPKKAEMKVYSNITVFELRVEIGKQFKGTWDQVKLVRNSGQKEIKDNENGKTLGEMRIRNGETLVASKRSTRQIAQATLMLPDGSMNPDAKKIFVEWFTEFSENGKMSPDQCAAFIHSCTNDFCKADDNRVKEVMATYDNDKDGFLTLENFLQFYSNACSQRPGVVWNNLMAHHYRNDLKKVTEVEEEKIDITTLSRYIISKNPEYYHIIFSLLDFGGTAANEAWKLLNRLPTSPQILTNILTLKGVKDSSEKNWHDVLDANSAYRLLYSLHVLEYLMEDEEEDEDDEQKQASVLIQDPKLLEHKKNWRTDFIACGGFDHLFKVFEVFSRKDHASLTRFDKDILSFILKILKNYLTATFASTVPYVYRSLSFIRLYLSLDFIQDYIHTVPSLEKQASATLEISATGESSSTTKLQKKDSKLDEKKKEKLKIEETEEFKVLVERLKGNLGQQILSKFNFRDFIRTLSTLGYDILQKDTDLESEDRMILEYTISILIAILLYDRSTISYFLDLDKKPGNFKSADKFILEGIFCSKAINVRRYFSHAVYVLCKYTTDYENAVVSKHFINFFLHNLPSSDDESRKDCIQYFDVLCKLIEETYAGKQDASSGEETFDFGSLAEKVTKRIKEHISIEKRTNLYNADKILIGLLNLCEKLVSGQPQLRDIFGAPEGHDLVKEIFSVCLFCIQEKESFFQDVIGEADVNSFSKDYVKCKTKESRSAAYKLLVTLCKNHPANLLILFESLKELMMTIFKYKTNQVWNYSPSSDTRAMNGFVGIRNLGCICYMNAMLQQFFMTPTFRYAILAADDKKEPNLVNKDNKFIIDDNVLHQLQQMFGFLEFSDRRDYNPFEFCFAHKDFTGQPTNVSIQQDTQEFLNTIFDRLENGLKHTPFKHILEGVYGGKTSNQIICNGCKNVREREELFYNLSVEVINMKTIYDSFEQFIGGEIIEDFFCESCQQKNSITKRTCLSYLPNVLIVHLKRIVFDLDTLMNQKINSRLEFPFELNLEPYTSEGLSWREKSKEKGKKQQKKQNKEEGGDEEPKDDKEEKEKEEEDREEEENGNNENKIQEPEEGPYQLHPKEYYQYKLAGVLVHIGTAEMGHYYSYININRDGNNVPSNDKWLEFNDSTVKDFDVKNIERECFGGSGSEASDEDWGFGSAKGGRENSKNAYILVYERVVKDPLKFVVQKEEDEAYLNKVLSIDRTLRENPQAVSVTTEEVGTGENKQAVKNYSCDYFMLKRFVPSNIYKKVWDDNHKFMFERHIYSDDFFKFFKEICNSLPLPALGDIPANYVYPEHTTLAPEVKQNVKNLIGILSLLVFNILSKSYENTTIMELSIMLKRFISLAPEAASHFFDNIVCKNMQTVLELFINCPDKQVRYCTTQVILHSINVMISYNNFTLDAERLNEKGAQADKLSEEEFNLCKQEDMILKFLKTLIGYLPTEVAKNWTKFGQYFEFWRDFAISGESQITFLFSLDFIAILLDFYLEKRSPLVGFSEKKYTLGNRYADPDFHALIQTVAYMVQRVTIPTKTGNVPFSSLSRQGFTLFEMTENDNKCLICRDFYEKTMKEKYHPQAFGVIIQQIAFENDMVSYGIADIILRGVNHTNFEDSKPYLDALVNFLLIQDYLQLRRAEWTLGFPQPTVTTGLDSSESFGMFGNISIEDSVITYDSPLNIEGCTSLINYMLHHRKRLINLSLLCLKQLLLIAELSPVMFEHIIYLPPPSYNYAKFTDWIQPFLDHYSAETKKYSAASTYPKEELYQEALKLWRSLEVKVNQRVEMTEKSMAMEQGEAGQKESESAATTTASTPAQTKEQGPDQGVKEGEDQKERVKEVTPIKGLWKTYIIGQTIQEEQINQKVLTQLEDSEDVTLVTTEVICYITESKPTGKGNLAFPAKLFNEGRFKSDKVKKNSGEAFFIKPRNPNIFNNMPPAAAEAPKQTANNDIEAAVQSNKEEYHDYASDNDDGKEGVVYGPMLPIGGHEMLKEFLQDVGKDLGDQDIYMSGAQNPDSGRGEAGYSPHNAASQELDHHDFGKTDGMEVEKEGMNQIHEAQETQQAQGQAEGQVEAQEGEELQDTEESDEANEFNYSVAPMLRRFIICNNTSYLAHCQLCVYSKSNEFKNFRLPSSFFNITVRPRSKACVLTLTKVFPSMDWGDYEDQCHVQFSEQPVEQRADNDSGKKKGAGFNIRPIEVGRNRRDAAAATADEERAYEAS